MAVDLRRDLTQPCQSMSARVARFLDKHARAVFETLLEREAAPVNPNKCEVKECNGKTTSTVYRCTQCFNPPVSCSSHVVAMHCYSPLHVIEEWLPERGFWQRCSLSSLGLAISLGPHSGNICPFAGKRSARLMTAVHERGVDTVRVNFCWCRRGLSAERAVEEPTQLLQAGLWPASWTEPHTFYTLGVMRLFRELSVTAHANAYDFYKTCTRLTGEIFPQDCKVNATLRPLEICRAKTPSGSISRVHGVDEGIQFHHALHSSWGGAASRDAQRKFGHDVPCLSSHRRQHGSSMGTAASR